MNTIVEKSDLMMDNNVQDIQDLHVIKELLQDVRSEYLRAVLYEDPEKTSTAITLIKEYQVKNQTYLDSFSGRIETEDQKAEWNDFLESMDKYRDARDTVLDLAATGNYQDAKARMDEATVYRKEAFAAIDSLIADNESILAQTESEIDAIQKAVPIFYMSSVEWDLLSQS